MDSILILILGIIPILVLIVVVFRILKGKEDRGIFYTIVDIFGIVVYPVLFLVLVDSGDGSGCCGIDERFFGPEYRLTAYAFIGAGMVGYFWSRFMAFRMYSPLVELFSTALLLFGLLFSLAVAIHLYNPFWLALGGIQVVLLFGVRLFFHFRRQRVLLGDNLEETPANALAAMAQKILRLSLWEQFPVLLLLCLPVLSVLITLLLLFGQRPDSIILAFTQSYNFGFSKLECVPCDGHYLCTIAAHGSPVVVKPLRAGIRARQEITVNRQLLIANAFEEILQEKFPSLHRFIRSCYDRIGRRATRFYLRLKKAWFANLLYYLMKPLEWGFLLVLYLVDVRPEDRIAQQYLRPQHRREIRRILPGRGKVERPCLASPRESDF